MELICNFIYSFFRFVFWFFGKWPANHIPHPLAISHNIDKFAAGGAVLGRLVVYVPLTVVMVWTPIYFIQKYIEWSKRQITLASPKTGLDPYEYSGFAEELSRIPLWNKVAAFFLDYWVGLVIFAKWVIIYGSMVCLFIYTAETLKMKKEKDEKFKQDLLEAIRGRNGS